MLETNNFFSFIYLFFQCSWGLILHLYRTKTNHVTAGDNVVQRSCLYKHKFNYLLSSVRIKGNLPGKESMAHCPCWIFDFLIKRFLRPSIYVILQISGATVS